MSFFNIFQEREISRAEEIRILYRNHKETAEKFVINAIN